MKKLCYLVPELSDINYRDYIEVDSDLCSSSVITEQMLLDQIGYNDASDEDEIQNENLDQDNQDEEDLNLDIVTNDSPEDLNVKKTSRWITGDFADIFTKASKWK